MKIVILGAGQVGGTLAEHLANEENDITVVDIQSQRLQSLGDRLDIQTVQGMASSPKILQQANIEEAELLIAVTSSDELNMVACQVAHTLFNTPFKIARIRRTDYLNRRELFNKHALPIDVLISPEQVVTNYIHRLLERPGALQVLDFANGKIQLIAIRAYYGGPLVGQEIRYLKEHIPGIETKVAAIFRHGEAIIPKGTTILEADDEVFFIADRCNIRNVMSEFQRLDDDYKRIMIAGGGNIGLRLSQMIENDFTVKLIENNYERSEYLSEMLENTMVLSGNASDKALLLAENVDEFDVFCALTNDDEANVVSSMLAKRLGVRKVITLINNPAYVELVQGGEIDIAISPQLATTSSLLKYVRRSDIVNVHSLRHGAAEAIELIVHGDKNSSQVVGKKINEINLPLGVTIGALVRDNQVFIAHDSTIIQTNDHVVMFLPNKQRIHEVESLFQPEVEE